MQQATPLVVAQMASSLYRAIRPSMILRAPVVFFKASLYSLLSSPDLLLQVSRVSCLKHGMAFGSLLLLKAMMSARDFGVAPAPARQRLIPSLHSYCRPRNAALPSSFIG